MSVEDRALDIWQRDTIPGQQISEVSIVSAEQVLLEGAETAPWIVEDCWSSFSLGRARLARIGMRCVVAAVSSRGCREV